MATNKEISTARNMQDSHIKAISKWTTSIPSEDANMQKLLYGKLCTGCVFLDVVTKKAGSPKVRINCKAGVNIPANYKNVELRNDPDCEKYIYKNGDK